MASEFAAVWPPPGPDYDRDKPWFYESQRAKVFLRWVEEGHVQRNVEGANTYNNLHRSYTEEVEPLYMTQGFRQDWNVEWRLFTHFNDHEGISSRRESAGVGGNNPDVGSAFQPKFKPKRRRGKGKEPGVTDREPAWNTLTPQATQGNLPNISERWMDRFQDSATRYSPSESFVARPSQRVEGVARSELAVQVSRRHKYKNEVEDSFSMSDIPEFKEREPKMSNSAATSVDPPALSERQEGTPWGSMNPTAFRQGQAETSSRNKNREPHRTPIAGPSLIKKEEDSLDQKPSFKNAPRRRQPRHARDDEKERSELEIYRGIFGDHAEVMLERVQALREIKRLRDSVVNWKPPSASKSTQASRRQRSDDEEEQQTAKKRKRQRRRRKRKPRSGGGCREDDDLGGDDGDGGDGGAGGTGNAASKSSTAAPSVALALPFVAVGR
ncbi:hypothetical protein M7I_3626 [Glarea lozoyensis 74030]|uniref:Uncharacterized protein n=1 Tax=Glarea lozoyensis (strain ATCC 74030 / MF5533) TaxID=1104152 RepID=H0EM00_GLAL7|nr:hypothetical protein M7I_3626 [Glarea lozoyensis 74030]